jgi:hypothetical protein
MCGKPKPELIKEPDTPEIQINENQWRCYACTVINEIDWNSKFKTECSMCGEPNQIIDEMIMQKHHYANE